MVLFSKLSLKIISSSLIWNAEHKNLQAGFTNTVCILYTYDLYLSNQLKLPCDFLLTIHSDFA